MEEGSTVFIEDFEHWVEVSFGERNGITISPGYRLGSQQPIGTFNNVGYHNYTVPFNVIVEENFDAWT